MQQNNESSTYNISGSLNLLHKVNRKENNLDYWYVCLVECRVNHNHLSIISSEYIIMISCSFVDVHPAVCIYQQSIMSQEPLKPSLKKKDQQLLIPGKVRCAVQCWDREHVNNKTMFQFLRCDTNTDKHFHLYCRCLGYYVYFNFQSRQKTLFSFCTSGILAVDSK